jgi:hypothetical protein
MINKTSHNADLKSVTPVFYQIVSFEFSFSQYREWTLGAFSIQKIVVNHFYGLG